MSSGLLALLDDVAAIAKVAAASVDDIAALSGKAGMKAAGIVIDDAAVTPRYVVGFGPNRELPIIWRIAVGSLRNKMLILLPAALAMAALAPWAITPLLMLGGLYLCFEGAEKLAEKFLHHDEGQTAAIEAVGTPAELEEARVSGAIRTDFILSAEIMAITLAGLPEGGFWMRATVLALVGLGITMLVYGAVALIVKADDAGVALARGRVAVVAALGRGLVWGMPHFLMLLGAVGTLAMLWVGGGIILHGLEEYGVTGPGRVVHAVAHGAAGLLPPVGPVLEWLVGAVLAGLLGLVLGGTIVAGMGLVRRPAH